MKCRYCVTCKRHRPVKNYKGKLKFRKGPNLYCRSCDNLIRG